MVGFIALAACGFAFLGVLYGVLLMIAITLTYAIAAVKFPETGGSYVYVKYAFGGALGFISAWLLALDQIIMVGYGTIDAAKVLSRVFALPINEVALAAALSTLLFALWALRNPLEWPKRLSSWT